MKTLQKPLTHLSVHLRVQAGDLSEYLGSRCLGHKRVELGARIVQGLEQFVGWFCQCVFAIFLCEYSLPMKDIFGGVAMMNNWCSFLLDRTC